MFYCVILQLSLPKSFYVLQISEGNIKKGIRGSARKIFFKFEDWQRTSYVSRRTKKKNPEIS